MTAAQINQQSRFAPSNASSLLLLLTIVVAPCTLGSITPPALLAMQTMSFAAVAAWCAGRVRSRRPRPISSICIGCIVALLLQGCWMTFNAKTAYDAPAGAFVLVAHGFTSFPGSADRRTSAAEMLTLTAVIFAGCVAADLARRACWRRRLFWTMSGTGAALAMFGVTQKLGWFKPVIDVDIRRDSGFFFSTFNYHGNAGTLLNLCLPASLSLAFITLRERRRLPVVVTLLLAVAILVGCVVNVSKAASAITGGIILVMIAAALLHRHRCRREKRTALVPSTAIVLFLVITSVAVVCAAIAAGPTESLWQRWAQLPAAARARWMMSRVATGMASDAGPFGTGPGTFKILMPHSPHMLSDLYANWIVRTYTPGETVPIWNHAHNDYLQILIEWGWVGGAFWAVLVFGGVLRLIRRLKANHYADEVRSEHARVLDFATAVALGGLLLHAAVDYPLQIASLRLYAAVYLAMAWCGPSDGPRQPEAPLAASPAGV